MFVGWIWIVWQELVSIYVQLMFICFTIVHPKISPKCTTHFFVLSFYQWSLGLWASRSGGYCSPIPGFSSGVASPNQRRSGYSSPSTMSGTAFFAGAATQSGGLECLGVAGNDLGVSENRYIPNYSHLIGIITWVCLKMLAKPLNPMVLLMIIPFLNG